MNHTHNAGRDHTPASATGEQRRRPGTPMLALAAAALVAGAAFTVPTATAQPANTTSNAGAAGTAGAASAAPGGVSLAAIDEADAHVAVRGTDGAAQPPLTSFSTARVEYGKANKAPARPSDAGAGNRAPQQACKTALIAAQTGGRLAATVTDLATSCVDQLSEAPATPAEALFTTENMAAVARGLRAAVADGAKVNRADVARSAVFLRSGFDAREDRGDTVAFDAAALRPLIDSAVRSLFANDALSAPGAGNGEVLAEALGLIDDADLNARHLATVENVLATYDQTQASSAWTLAAVNNSFTVLYGGHDDPAFVAAAARSKSLVPTLTRFTRTTFADLGSARFYLASNAARELGRFLSHRATAPKVRPAVRAILVDASPNGSTAPVWVGLAEMTDSYDKSRCGYYKTCGFSARVAAAVAKTTYTCSSSIVIKAQSMTSSELASTCSSLRSQDAYFHSVARDPGPVANDYNTRLEVVVYDSSTDYKTYAGAEYGINTNNGGMYLEGNPAAAGNQPRFIAYEAEWQRPTFAIWNLNHEYTHYLDGRFDMYGDFNANVSTPTIWWIEGFAEYISYSYRNLAYTEAQAEAARGTYTLRTLFDTTYSNDSTRIYRWGYLAAAFMVNKHPNELATVLGYYRAGDYNGARTYLTSSIGTRYDAEFRTYLTQCAAGNCAGGGTGSNASPTASFTSAANGLSVAFTDTSTDSDGSIASRSWSFGDGTSSTAANPSKTYTAAGSYTVSLNVTDDQGATSSVTKTVTVGSGGGTPVAECTDADVRKLDRGCQRSGRSATAGNNDYLFIYVPAGVAQLRFTSQGGTGDADLYYSAASWATPSSYTLRSAGASNTETITVNNPAAGYHYITAHGATSFSGVTVTAQ